MKTTTLTCFLFAAVIANPAWAASGDEVYQRQCSACHGATGAGDGPQAGTNGIAAPRAFTVTAKERMAAEKVMLQPSPSVPGHGGAALLTPEELRKLIDHVHKLANP